MNRCQDRDQDLLMLTHGALSPVARLRTEWHLRGCPRCQERLTQFTKTSQLLASGLRDKLHPWTSAVNPSLLRNPILPLWSYMILLAVVLLTVLFFGIRQNLHRPNHHSFSSPTITSHPSNGCDPGLPSDRCR